VTATLWAGPIVRRVTPTAVHLWFAADRELRLDCQLHRLKLDPELRVWVLGDLVGLGRGALGSTSPERGGTRSLQLGSRLWVSLTTIVPHGVAAFPRGEPLGYLVGVDDQLLDLRELAYTNAGYAMPTIVVPTDGTVHALHGSCRKIHGHGDDATYAADWAVADRLEAESSAQLAKARRRGAPQPAEQTRRPPALFLTGDQIYADDVSPLIAKSVQAIGRTLMGADERIPFPSPAHAKMPIRAARAGQRGALLSGVFSSTAMDDHLISFGEFAAMYLLAWGARPWNHVRLERPARAHVVSVPMWTEALDARASSQALASVQQFRRRLPQARRLMANAACYMMLDDHEVTDDWNITPQWIARTSGFPLARRVISNALTAFALFQGWGNDPDALDPQILTALAARARQPDGPRHRAIEQWLDQHDWSFVTPGKPGVAFIDTRTQRDASGHPAAPCGLRDAAALDRTVTRIVELARDREVVVFVSPVPLVGLPTIDGAQAFAARGGDPTGLDFEGWIANGRTLYALKTRLLERLAGKRCVVLSGDVHFSYAANEQFRPASGGRALSFLQFTASALKNSSIPETFAARLWNLDESLAKRVGIPRFGPWRRTVVLDPSAEAPAEAAWPEVRPPPREVQHRLAIEGAPLVLSSGQAAGATRYVEEITWLWSGGSRICFFRESAAAEVFATADKVRGQLLRLHFNQPEPVSHRFGDAEPSCPF
jgi:hypothetical protein